MLIKCDAKALEFRAAMDLSGDPVGIREILEGADIHEDNRLRFNLPTRLIAKTFLFRLLYGGSAYAYTKDNEFSFVSTSEKFWQKVIDETYNKYKGLARWHKEIVQEVTRTGKLGSYTGREWTFTPSKDYKGEMKWPVTKIKNYPVQGLGADLVQIARVSAWRRFKEERESNRVLFINSVHDDIQLDIVPDPELCYNICIDMEKVFQDVPANVKKIYGYEMKVPLAGEVSFGMDLGNMKEFDTRLGKEQFL